MIELGIHVAILIVSALVGWGAAYVLSPSEHSTLAAVAPLVLTLLNAIGAVIFGYAKDESKAVAERARALPDYLANNIVRRIAAWRDTRLTELVFGAALFSVAAILQSEAMSKGWVAQLSAREMFATRVALGTGAMWLLLRSLSRRNRLNELGEQVELLRSRFEKRKGSLAILNSAFVNPIAAKSEQPQLR